MTLTGIFASDLINFSHLCKALGKLESEENTESLHRIQSTMTAQMIEKYKGTKDYTVDKVINKFKERSEKGIIKYGTTLSDNPAPLLEWLEHLQEELMDATLYIERLKKEL